MISSTKCSFTRRLDPARIVQRIREQEEGRGRIEIIVENHRLDAGECVRECCEFRFWTSRRASNAQSELEVADRSARPRVIDNDSLRSGDSAREINPRLSPRGNHRESRGERTFSRTRPTKRVPSFPLKATLEIRKPLHVQVAIARLHTCRDVNCTDQIDARPLAIHGTRYETRDRAASRSASRRRGVRDQRFTEADNTPLFRESMEGTAG